MIKPRTPPGVMELLPCDQVAFQRMLDAIRRTFEGFGFAGGNAGDGAVEILLTKSGGETERQVYFVQSTGALEKRDEGLPEPRPALRPDRAAGALRRSTSTSCLPVPPLPDAAGVPRRARSAGASASSTSATST